MAVLKVEQRVQVGLLSQPPASDVASPPRAELNIHAVLPERTR